MDKLTIEASKQILDGFYKHGSVSFQTLKTDVSEWDNNEYVILKADGSSALAYADTEEECFRLINTKRAELHGIRPKDVQQTFAFDALQRLSVIALIGGAGTGKTTISSAFAIHSLFRENKRIVLCKSTAFVGGSSNAIAAIPGDHREKLAGYIDSYLCAFRRVLGDHAEHHLYEWEEKGLLEFKPIELLRGMHFEDCIVILDEAQNTTPHEILTLMSRIADTSKLIVMGDPLQIDLDQDYRDSGLGMLMKSDAFIESDVSAMIKLNRNYRGVLADLAHDILLERQQERDTHADV